MLYSNTFRLCVLLLLSFTLEGIFSRAPTFTGAATLFTIFFIGYAFYKLVKHSTK